MMANLSAPATARCPVPARQILIPVERRAVWTRARENVVPVGRVTDTVHVIESFGDCSLPVDPACGTVKLLDVCRDEKSLSVVPGTVPDPVTRVHGRLSPGGHGAEIRAPIVIPGPFSFRERLAMCVGSGQAPKVSACTKPGAGDEKLRHGFGASHRNGLRDTLCARRRSVHRVPLSVIVLAACAKDQGSTQYRTHTVPAKQCADPFHLVLPDGWLKGLPLDYSKSPSALMKRCGKRSHGFDADVLMTTT
jgi:hypothetical protein